MSLVAMTTGLSINMSLHSIPDSLYFLNWDKQKTNDQQFSTLTEIATNNSSPLSIRHSTTNTIVHIPHTKY